jgi:hypothetical protein
VTDDAPQPGFPRNNARTLPVGTVIRTHGEDPVTLTREDRPGRCPWRCGPAGSRRYVATWHAQHLINDGATVTKPTVAGVKRPR